LVGDDAAICCELVTSSTACGSMDVHSPANVSARIDIGGQHSRSFTRKRHGARTADAGAAAVIRHAYRDNRALHKDAPRCVLSTNHAAIFPEISTTAARNFCSACTS